MSNSAVLKTTFRTPSGTATLIDFIHLREGEADDALAVPDVERRVRRLLEGV